MRQFLLSICFFLFSFTFVSQAQNWEQVILDGSTVSDQAYDVVVDPSGNVYYALSFNGTLIVGDSTFVSRGNTDAAMASYDANGVFRWARHIAKGASGNEEPYRMALDNNNNIYVVGYSTSAADTLGTTTFVSGGAGTIESWLTTYTSNGNFRYAKRVASGSGNAHAYGVTVDPLNHIYVTGFFSGLLQNVGDSMFTSIGDDVYLVSYDSAGNFRFARQVTTGAASQQGFDVQAGPANNIYVVGKLTAGSSVVGDTTITVTTGGAFLVAFDSLNNYQFARRVTNNTTAPDIRSSVTVANDGSVFVAGTIQGAVTNVGDSTFATNGFDGYIAKYSANGVFSVAKRNASGTGTQRYFGLNKIGASYVAGVGLSSASSTIGDSTFTNDGGFLILMNNNLDFITAAYISPNSTAYGVDGLDTNDIWVAGKIGSAPTNFNNNFTVNSAGGSDAFLASFQAFTPDIALANDIDTCSDVALTIKADTTNVDSVNFYKLVTGTLTLVAADIDSFNFTTGDSSLYVGDTLYLVATGYNSDGDSVSDTIMITTPERFFTLSADTVCASANTNFTSSSSARDSLYFWDFENDGTNDDTTTVASNSYNYGSGGLYTLKVVKVYNNACRDSQLLNIQVDTVPPVIFTADTVCAGFPTSFSATANTYDSVYIWDFQNDGINDDTTTVPNTTFTYASAGLKTAHLTIVTKSNCVDSATLAVQVDTVPLVIFTADTVCFGTTTTFNATANSFDSLYYWDFDNDGINDDTTTVPTSTFTYPNSGDFTAQLEIISKQACSDSATIPVHVDSIPLVVFEADTVCQTFATTFTANTNTFDSLYVWDFDNDGSNDDTTTVPTTTYIYPAAGIYTAELRIISKQACTDSSTIQVQVDTLPVIIFSADTVCNREVTTFNVVPNSFDSLYYWDFNNDGLNDDTTAVPTTSVIYGAEGVFTAKLTILSKEACLDSGTIQVMVDSLPKIKFGADTVCYGQLTTFTDSSVTPAGSTYAWDFNSDGAIDDHFNGNKTYHYLAAGIYKAKLNIIRSDNGCSLTDSILVQVDTLPEVLFNANTVCFGDTTRFTEFTTTSDSSYFAWDFTNDGIIDTTILVTTGNKGNIKHVYASAGTYDATLIVTNKFGCSDSLSVVVTVNPSPIASFTADTVCEGTKTSYTNTSTAVVGSIYNWDFNNDGNDDASGKANKKYQFDSAGVYTAQLFVQNPFGCISIFVDTVIVDTVPNVSFSADTVCLGDTTVFTDLSSRVSAGASYMWDFDGNGSIDSTSSGTQKFVFGTAGTFTSKLYISNANGCIDTFELGVNVRSLPTVAFSANQVCEGVSTTFTDLSSAAAVATYSWDFDNDNVVDVTSNGGNTSFTYPSSGIYTAQLVISDAFGCVDSASISVQVDTLPIVGFTTDTVCKGNPTTFTDTSTTKVGSSYAWDFDNNGTNDDSTAGSTSYQYANAGTYTAKLTITNTNSCVVTVMRTVIVDTNALPSFTANTVCFGDTTIFTDASSFTSGSLYNWDFDGDGVIDSANQAPGNNAFVYASAGDYVAKLIINKGNGCVDSITYNVTVRPTPIALFSTDTVCEGAITTFTDLSTTAASVNYKWDFNGDGIDDDNQAGTRQYTFANAGVYTARLIIVNQYACLDTFTATVIVDTLPVADFAASEVCLNDSTVFTDFSSTTINSTFDWDFNNDGVVDASIVGTNGSVKYVYAAAGAYKAKLTITNKFGCIDSKLVDVTVNNNPLARFSADTVCEGLATTFLDSSITTAGAVYEWDFNGDGIVDNNIKGNKQYTFASAGVYTATLLITNSKGCVNADTQIIVVDTVPNPLFTADTVCLDVNTTFTDLSTEVQGATAYEWDFNNDGVVDDNTAGNKSFLYPTAGTYVAKLTIINGNGCSDVYLKNVVVNPKPIVAFKSDSVCVGTPTHFVDQSTLTGVGSTYAWDFDNNGTTESTVAGNVNFTYASDGIFTAELMIVNEFGCTDSTSNFVVVHELPTVDFAADTVCEGVETSFSDLSVTTPGSKYSWNFGNDNFRNSNTVGDVTYLYPHAGVYTAILTVTNSYGCVDSISKTIVVDTVPNPLFEANQVCFTYETEFKDLSTEVQGAVYNWDFDNDGLQEDNTVGNTGYIYPSPGVYTASLTITNANGCSDTFRREVIVNPPPVVNFTVDTVCEGNLTSFTNLSSRDPGTLYEWDFDSDGIVDDTKPGSTKYLYPQDGIYTARLIVINGLYCVDSFSRTVVVNVIPDVYVGEDTTIFRGDVIALNPQVTPTAGMSYLWSPSVGLNNPSQANVQASPEATTTYTLLVSSNAGCSNSDDITINVIDNVVAETVFTPDGDGVNDVWIIRGLGQYPDALIEVYSRAGVTVFSTKDYANNKWNGEYEGKPVPIGAYYFVIRMNDELPPKTGSVTLIR